ncbi:HlyC/CorC family transporter [Labrys sp. KNU-23]|uniref:transporter associated domain-containing protein n=1 Tax=Labrys sp. KNU-23 TaxID=2789216 RepID=UPI0011ECA1C5|nr:hemolysin family protein [Labrys sp. KNU-23]QEN89662.1 HlyC/CorC family transporter [Labrys sp. KNU-23]
MSDSNDRSSSQPSASQEPQHEGLLGRIKSALGLKSQPSIRDDLADALENSRASEDSSFSPEERAMLKNILGLRGKRVDDVMVPRADIVAVPLDISLGDLLKVFQTAGHSRLPVYNETLDDPRGMVHIRDFVAWLASRAAIAARRSRKVRESDVGKDGEAAKPSPREAALALGNITLSTPLSSVKSLTRNVLFVPPSMPPIDLLAKMQATRTQLALVIDEYGGTDGLVSMEDIVEIVLGDIEDEHDEDDGDMIVPSGEGIFTADARADLDDVAAAIGLEMHEDEIEADVDTLGGWLVTLAGRVPVRGEIVQGPGQLEFEILDADPRRVKRVRIHMTGSGITRPRDGRKREKKAVPAADEAAVAANEARISASETSGDGAT